MNLSKRLIGRMIEITWADPNTGRDPIETLKRGRAALATWKEYGMLHDLTDGVAILAHSYAMSPGGNEPDEIQYTAVAESLIENVRVFAEEFAPARGAGDASAG